MLLSLQDNVWGSIWDEAEMTVTQRWFHACDQDLRLWLATLQSLTQVDRSAPLPKETLVHALDRAGVLIELKVGGDWLEQSAHKLEGVLRLFRWSSQVLTRCHLLQTIALELFKLLFGAKFLHCEVGVDSYWRHYYGFTVLAHQGLHRTAVAVQRFVLSFR